MRDPWADNQLEKKIRLSPVAFNNRGRSSPAMPAEQRMTIASVLDEKEYAKSEEVLLNPGCITQHGMVDESVAESM